MKLFGKEIKFTNPIKIAKQTTKGEPLRLLKSLNSSGNGTWDFLGTAGGQLGDFKINKKALYRVKKVNSDVNQCIDMRANNTSLNGLKLIDRETGEIADETDNKMYYDYVKRLFQAGTDYAGTFKLFKSDVFCEAYINGCLFLEPAFGLGGEDGMSGDIKRFDVLSGRNTRCVYSKGKLVGFQNGRTFGMNGESANFNVNDIGYFIYNRDPENKHGTMGLLEGIFYDILQDLEQTKAGWSYYQNGLFPGMVFMLDDRMSKEEQEQFNRELKKMYSGAEGAGKRITGNGIKDMKEVHINVKDLDIINSRHFNTEKVCSALGTDKRIIWYEGENGNRAERFGLIKQWYEMTIQPDEARLESVLNGVLKQFQNRLELTDLPDRFEVQCYGINVSDQEQKTKLALEQYKVGTISMDEMREESGRDRLENEWSQKHYMPSKMVEVGLQTEQTEVEV